MMSQAFGIWSATESAFLERELRIFESEIVTPDGAQPSVLLNDGLDQVSSTRQSLFLPLRRRRF